MQSFAGFKMKLFSFFFHFKIKYTPDSFAEIAAKILQKRKC